MNRRDFMIKGALAASLPLAFANANAQAPTKKAARKPKFNAETGEIHWLTGSAPAAKTGATFGLPWPQGASQASETLALRDAAGKSVPLQTWHTAFWPDGSIKWTAHAIPAAVDTGDRMKIEKGSPAQPKQAVSVTESNGSVVVDTGKIRCVIPQSGDLVFTRLERDGKLIASNARLIGTRQPKAELEPGESVEREEFQGRVSSVSVEQDGPVRSVVKIDGDHRCASGKQWLPFSLRLYSYAGGDSVRITHTFIYDGDDQVDFISSLGVRFDAPQQDELHNRHIRFVGEGDGVWGESPRGVTGLRRDPGQAVRDAQIAGVATPPVSEWSEAVSTRIHWIPTWGDYTLSQLNANGFSVRKRTKAGHSWIPADQGHRASGVAYVGGVSGGVLFGLRDFWQLHPTQLDIRGADTEQATATVWIWSPEAPAMDVRFYHDGLGQETHEQQLDALNITYEDYEPGFGTAVGVARTSEFTLHALAATPSREDTVALAESIRNPGVVVAAPQDYLKAGVFGGLWSLPDRSSAKKRAIEDRLDWSVDFYRDQVDQRHWYGFWDYGDVMHTYDADRHVWRYDVGGYAWDNSELSPDLWLWYSFLRTGDEQAFRLAEAMTRHNRDVDIYHLGRFKGLGTRHNVQHWGCSAKQLRISTSAYRRFHYYITGDERTGDVLREVVNADEQLGQLNPTRKLPGQSPVPAEARMGVGTDWGSAACNWLTEWERTGDPKYKEWIENAMRTIGEQELGFFVGTFGYDPETKELIPPENPTPSISHLSAVFGLIEVCAELNQLIDVPKFKEAWLQYGRLYSAPDDEQKTALGRALRGNSLTVGHSRLTAYVAAQTDDKSLAKRAWSEFEQEWGGKHEPGSTRVEGPQVLNPIDEAAWVSTNDASQWGLAAIQNLALVPKAL